MSWNPLEFEFTFNENLQAKIYDQRGKYHALHNNWVPAKADFKNVLKINPNDLSAKTHQSIVESELGNTNNAHELLKNVLGKNTDGVSSSPERQYANVLYDMNEFEWSLAHICNIMDQKLKLKNKRETKIFADVIKTNLENVIGAKSRTHLQNGRKFIETIKEIDLKKIKDNRPLWKQRLENQECDTESVEELFIKPESKLKRFSRQNNEAHIHQLYLGYKTTQDIKFLKNVANNTKTFDLPQMPDSTNKLKEIMTDSHKKATEWSKMLYNRQPIYSKNFLYPKIKEIREKQLFYKQYQTRRDAFALLEKSHQLLRGNDLEKLLKHTEDALESYYSIKTTRVFPRKFEFMQDMCNIVGIAYVKKLRIPAFLKLVPLDSQLQLLLDINTDEKYNVDKPTFGDKSTFKDPTKPDYSYLKLQKRCDYFEKRTKFAEHPIEQCYLCHEHAILNLKLNKLDEARTLGKKIMNNLSGNNYVWKFLGALIIIKSNVIQSYLEKNVDDMNVANQIAEKINENCAHFMKVMIYINEELLKQRAYESLKD